MPTTAEHIGVALEAHIRSRISDRRWYRRNRDVYAWSDLERENDRELRLLFRVRSDARRQERAAADHLRQMRAAHEAREWAESVSVGRYILLPDVPLAADPGDHFVGRTA